MVEAKKGRIKRREGGRPWGNNCTDFFTRGSPFISFIIRMTASMVCTKKIAPHWWLVSYYTDHK